KQFAKVNFREDEKRALKKLKTYRLSIDKESRRLIIFAVFDSLIDKNTYYAALDRIKETLELNKIETETRFDGVYFSEECFDNIIATLKRENESVFAGGFFEDAEATYGNGTFRIKLRDNVEPSILYENSIDTIISNIIKNEYGVDADVVFDGKVDISYIPKYIEEQEELDRENYQKYVDSLNNSAGVKSPSLMPLSNSCKPEYESDNVVKAGRMKFDVSERKVIFGKEIKKLSTTINGIKDGDNVSFVCFCFLHEKKDTKDYTKVNHKIQVTDLEASIIVRFTLEKEIAVKAEKKAFIIEGKASLDKFEGELVVKARSINEIKQIRRSDDHPTPRVELHLHTIMSATDGFCDPSDVLQAAEDMGMPAVAFTDHGNIQSYPLVMKGLKAHKNVKPIYGMEGYFVDDTARAVYNFPDGKEYSLSNDEYVVFDIETTGLSPADCGITEIGAVRYKNGEVIDVFETFVDPGMHIPEKITELTGITVEMVKGAPDTETAVKYFLEFTGERILVAHNAPFDISFIRKAAQDHKLPFNNPYIDTVALSRFINPDLKKHKLDIVADYFHLGTFNHHRATDDATMLAKIFECLIKKFEKVGVKTVAEMITEMENKADPKKLRSYHITILVKNKTGLKNLYKLVSKSYLDYYYRNPRIPKTVLSEYREGLLIGTACESGEFYTAVREGRPYGDLMKIANFYDYFEIQPHGNNMFLVERGEFGNDRQQGIERLSNINRQIISIAEKQGKPVVATGDVHFLYPDDE
ncbi:MAG: PHP domain-containing protein, partial [Clostridia bacterium]|nr:PHP domain-containing protein [Clostridia bacterium]